MKIKHHEYFILLRSQYRTLNFTAYSVFETELAQIQNSHKHRYFIAYKFNIGTHKTTLSKAVTHTAALCTFFLQYSLLCYAIMKKLVDKIEALKNSNSQGRHYGPFNPDLRLPLDM